MESLKNKTSNFFFQKFGTEALTVCSPGRINLIGEHTDYNMGFVLPAAIDKAAYVAIGKRNDNTVCLYSLDLEDSLEINIQHIIHSSKEWANYILGVVSELNKLNIFFGGFNLVFSGDVPLGAGMSSSAALECATVFALNQLFGLGLEKMQLTKIAQEAEREFVGVKCGIMDQFASVFGKKDHVIKLDCRSLDYEYVPFNLSGIKIVLFDSLVKHSLASSEYNVRSQQCQLGISQIQKKYPEVKTLRDATMEMVEACVDKSDLKVYNRCKFVVEEIERLQLACNDLELGDLQAFGKKMFETHDGLSNLYEVSCPELDFIANLCKKEENIIGARMMGGGFGGCVIALINEASVEEVSNKIKEAYLTDLHKEINIYHVNIEDGTRVV